METSGAILRATGRPTDRGNLPTCPLVDTTAGAAGGAVSALIIAVAAVIAATATIFL